MIGLPRRALLGLPAALLAAGLPLAALTATSARHGAPAQAGLTIGQPVMAAPATQAQPSADPTPDPAATPAGVPVHLPLLGFGGTSAGPAPAARPGSEVVVPSVGLRVGVVDYGDCSGNTAMTRVAAVHFLCTPGAVTTFVGHNPGVFTPLLRTQPGDRVLYRHDGGQQVFVISARYRVSPQDAAAYSQDGSYPHAVFATCAEPDSSAYWVFLPSPLGGQTGAPPSPASNPSSASSSHAGPGHPAPSPTPSPSPTPGTLPGGVTLPPPPPPPL